MLVLVLVGLVTWTNETEIIFQPVESFIEKTFNSDPPEKELLWIKKDLKSKISRLTRQPFEDLTIPYWREGGRTAWILNELGKEQPITIGVVVYQGKIQSINVLVYREKEGMEVRYPFFTGQFTGSALTRRGTLNSRIDSLSGATFSSKALIRASIISLILSEHLSTLQKIVQSR